MAQQPNLMFLKDIDGDDRADTRELILHGFDSADSHHSISAFTWGPGGGIYMHEGTFHHTSVETHSGPVRNAHGAVYRFEPTTQNFETFVTYNFANPWGHAFDSWGQNFVADASGGANYFATAFSGKAPQYLGQEDFGPFKFGNRSQMRQFIKMRVRPTAGCEFVSSGHFPPSAQGNFLLNNVIGFQGVLQHRMADEGSGFVGTEIEPLLFSSDRNFRPTDLQFGPDGALYVVDWFNPLIGHMQHNLRDPNRDKSHGRVWRITYPSRPLLKPPSIADESVPALLELLKSFEDRTRYRVRLELRERDTREVVAALEQWIADLDPSGEEYEHHLLEALWVHQHHNVVDESLLKRLLRSPDYRARAAATRVLSFWRNRVQDAPGLLKVQVNDDHPRVRLEAVRAASFLRGPEAARVALGVLEHPMDDYLEYTLGETIRALRPDWEPFMTSGETLVESAVGTDYLLGRLDVADLQKVARTRSSYRAFLARPGVAREFREEALEGLATLNSSSPVSEVLEAIRRADREDSENAEAVLTDLGRMLESRPVSELEAFRQEIEAIAGSGRRQTTRQFGEVALIVADQGADRSWERAARSSKRLLNLLTSVPLISDPQLRASLFEQLAQIIEGSPTGGDRSAEIRAAAIAALPSLTGKESESARLLIRIVSGKEPDEAAIRAIGRLDRVTIDADDRLTLLQSLVRYLEAIPAGRRTSGDPLEAADLAEELASSLSGHGADDLRQRLSDLSVTVIEIKPIPHRMQYDLAEFFVEAGRPVEIVFENVDIMPHNLILTVPGARTEVGIAADRMASRPDAFDLQFIPRSDKVLFATRMLQPQQMEKLRFIAPNQVGDYPYLCTFPGHWLTMFGTMHVVADLDSVTPAVMASRDEAAVEVRAFVRAWKLEDLEGDLRALDADRNFENGAHLFEALSCSQCHRMNGRGGQVGPDLALVRDKLASGELDRAGLLREVVEPSGVVQKEYLMEVIETEDGRLFNGLVTHEDDRVIRLIPNLLDPERTEEVSKGSIKDRWQSTVSPMPEGLINTAERRDVFDLIAFLATGGLKPTAEVQPAAERENK